MNKINYLLSITSLVIWSGITTITSQVPALAGDVSPLCKNRNMETEVAINTEEFYASICSTGYIDRSSGCYISNKYFYVGQSRKTAESITLPATRQLQESPYLLIYKAKNGNYTYQIATTRGYGGNPWTSLSVFNKSKRSYHRKVNSYYGL